MYSQFTMEGSFLTKLTRLVSPCLFLFFVFFIFRLDETSRVSTDVVSLFCILRVVKIFSSSMQEALPLSPQLYSLSAKTWSTWFEFNIIKGYLGHDFNGGARLFLCSTLSIQDVITRFFKQHNLPWSWNKGAICKNILRNPRDI